MATKKNAARKPAKKALAKTLEKKKAAARPAHRPTKLDADVVRRILCAVEEGKTDERASHLAGIHPRTLSGWKARAEEYDAAVIDGEPAESGDEEFSQFLRAYREARGVYLDGLEVVVHRDARSDARLALDVLSRRDPDKWGRRTSVSVSGDGGGPVVFTSIVPNSRI